MKTYFGTLVLHEGRIHFSRAGVAVRVNSGVEQQIVLPCLAPTFASKLLRNTTCRDDDAVAVESIRSVDEWQCVTRSCCIVECAVGEGDGRRTLSVVGCGVVWRWLAPSATP